MMAVPAHFYVEYLFKTFTQLLMVSRDAYAWPEVNFRYMCLFIGLARGKKYNYLYFNPFLLIL